MRRRPFSATRVPLSIAVPAAAALEDHEDLLSMTKLAGPSGPVGVYWLLRSIAVASGGTGR